MDASAACYGIGYCSGTTEVVDELSPAGMAAAVCVAAGLTSPPGLAVQYASALTVSVNLRSTLDSGE